MSSLHHHIIWEVSKKCNMACSMCYASSGCMAFPELSYKKKFEVMAKFKEDINATKIVMVGGEPFILPYISDIIEPMLINFPRLSIQTNGTIPLSRTLTRLYNFINNVEDDYGINKEEVISKLDFNVSLESSDITKNDEIRGRGQYHMALATLAELRNSPFSTWVRTMIRQNDNPIDIIKDVCTHPDIKCNFVGARFIPAGRGDKFYSWMVKSDNLAKIYTELKKLQRLYPNQSLTLTDVPWSLLTETREHLKVFKKRGSVCEAYTGNRLFVDCVGDTYPCPFLTKEEFKLGNILTTDVEVLREKSRNFKYILNKMEISKNCTKCGYWDMCHGGCIALSLAHGAVGDPECPMYKVDPGQFMEVNA